ncbi:hypothetical protein RHSIM_Rhsim01G0073400 [Rhododendron simsii]|uniref:Translation initiation factor beta propellor-like domain-containing protein n=1 Tax=Rhododendron simsii TaxID=118357 RepID=A0A834HJH5_RHOSS|nr:hypothetical protein RHSIM_Rhsim01G0073400 [Rhododendron simsii]
MSLQLEVQHVGTSVTSVHEMTNGFNIWSFNGKLLYRILKDHFFQGIRRANPEEVIFTHTRGKQFLIMRNVPCLRSAASVEEEYEATGGEVLLDNEDNDGWLATMEIRKITNMKRKKTCLSMETLEISKENTIQSIASHFGGEEEEDIPNMAEYEEPDNLIETDPEPDDDIFPRTRTYDVSITYEKYYQTPRVWLTGYDEVGHNNLPFLH